MSRFYTYGLVGEKLTHSFSSRFFEKKFEEQSEQLSYELFELKKIEALPKLLHTHPTLGGLNITFPYKTMACRYVDELHPLAKRIGAVNVLKRLPNGRWRGYNTDHFGFSSTLKLLPKGKWQQRPALICGRGGAGLAVGHALLDTGIRPHWVSRQGKLRYEMLQSTPDFFRTFGLIVQATPLGTYPNTESPPLPYAELQREQLLYDLVYNPAETLFLREGHSRGCYTINGEAMLYAQAEESWRIWQEQEHKIP